MKRLIAHIIYLALGILLVALTVADAVAQKTITHIVVNRHDTIEFSVEEWPGDRYTWDIYTDSTLNFAHEHDHLDPAVYFVDGMYEGNTVRVTGLEAGRYFVRVMVWDDVACTNNLLLFIVDILDIPEADLYGDEACFGDPTFLKIVLTGTGPWEIIYTDGIDSETVNLIGDPGTEIIIPINPFPTKDTEYWISYIKDIGSGGENLIPGQKVKVVIYPIPVNSKIYLKK